MDETRKKLTFRGGMFFSLVPVVIYVFFCVVLFIIFKAFNMEALAVGGFIALLVGGLFCTSYSEFWDSAVRGISSITSVSVVVILLLTGMFSQLIKICGLSGGFVWLANSFGIRGGLFVAFTFLATCIVSTATGSSIGTMFIAFPIFYPAGLILGANPMWMAGCIVSGAVFGDNLAPISDTTIASSSTQQFHDGRPADIGGVVSSRVQYSAVAGLITIVFFAIVGGIGGTYQGGEIDAVSNPTTLVMLLPVVVMLVVSTKTRNIFLCQVGTKKILRIYKPFIGGQPPVNGLRFLYALVPFFVRRFLYAAANASNIGVTGSSLSGLDRYSNRMPFSRNFRSNLMKEEVSRLIREVSRVRIVPMS